MSSVILHTFLLIYCFKCVGRCWYSLGKKLLIVGFAISFLLKACEKALMCSRANHVAHPEMDDFFPDAHAIKKIKRLKDTALLKISSQSGMYF